MPTGGERRSTNRRLAFFRREVDDPEVAEAVTCDRQRPRQGIRVAERQALAREVDERQRAAVNPGRLPEERPKLVRQRNAELGLELFDFGRWHRGLEPSSTSSPFLRTSLVARARLIASSGSMLIVPTSKCGVQRAPTEACCETVAVGGVLPRCGAVDAERQPRDPCDRGLREGNVSWATQN